MVVNTSQYVGLYCKGGYLDSAIQMLMNLYEMVFDILGMRPDWEAVLNYGSTLCVLILSSSLLLHPLHFDLIPLLFLSLIAYHGGLDSDGNQANTF